MTTIATILLLIFGLALAAVGVAFAGGLIVWGVRRVPAPTSRWTFEVDGHTVEVLNYVTKEEVHIDGALVEGTWASGDGQTYADHQAVLHDGRVLSVAVAAHGSQMRCTARLGDRFLFDSRQSQVVPAPAVTATEPTDPRWAAATVLLDELAQMPDAAKTAAAVRIEVSGALSRLASARESAEAHCALGGSMADVAERLAHQEAAVNDVLALLRRLHVAANAVHTDRTDVARVEESIHKLEADREVAALHARARAATRPREQR